MKNLMMKNRYTLLLSVLGAYVAVIVLEGLVTGREPDWLTLDNSLFTLDLRNLEELQDLEIDL